MTTAASITNIAGILLTDDGVEAPSPAYDATAHPSIFGFGFIIILIFGAFIGFCLIVVLITLVSPKLQAIYKTFRTAQIHPQTSDVELGRA